MSTSQQESFWGLLEIMGHQRFAGLISEQAIAGTGFVRIDVPASDAQPAFSKLFGTGSIYAVTPMVEEVARELAKGLRRQPLSEYDFSEELLQKLRAGHQALLALKVQATSMSDDDDDCSDDDEQFPV